MKILIVDDSRIDRTLCTNTLKQAGVTNEILEAVDGKDGLNVLQKNHKDICLILLDWNMPIMNGIESLKEIRKFNKNIPVIALTAADIEEVKNDFSSIGFNDIVTKPFDNFEFYQKITVCIQHYKLKVSSDDALFRAS